MPPNTPDSQLVQAYAAEGSENAFRALVARHVDLVFATALRQVGDAGAAEEITQNVFVALARKAPRLGGVETLAGWLHRTAILEAKARVRQELRRERREETAAQIAFVQREGSSPLEALVPLLDEALLNLRDGDRLALLLRFFEERSLRDVGESLGVDEDAARKRVSRALERVTEFFRKRGFAVPAGTGVAALFANAAQAAPVALASNAANAGLAPGGAATGLNTIFFHLMSLTKTQTAAVCAVVVALPLTLQWPAEGRVQRLSAETQQRLAESRQGMAELNLSVQQSETALANMHAERIQAEARRAEQTALRAGQPVVANYVWDDGAALVRVPKEMLKRIQVQSLETIFGKPSEQIRETLQMTDAEAARVGETVGRFIAAFRDIEAANLKPAILTASELGRRSLDEVRVFELPDLTEDYLKLRESAFASLREVLGQERFELFAVGMNNWIPTGDVFDGVNSNQVLFPGAKRVRFYRPGAGNRNLTWSVQTSLSSGGRGTTGLSYDPPEPYRRLVADWMDLAQTAGQGRQVVQETTEEVERP
jgi:RNA polymerase sigma factor (sigma-70 family)